MDTHEAISQVSPLVLGAGDGQHFEFLNNLATVKVRGGDVGSMSVVEFLAPHGFGPPEHIHRDEDELFLILEGTLSFFTQGEKFSAGAGGCAFLPRGIAHTFQVVTESARLVNVTATSSVAPQFDLMVSTLGTETGRLTIPEPAYIDAGNVAEVCAQHGIDIVGPPPAEIV